MQINIMGVILIRFIEKYLGDTCTDILWNAMRFTLMCFVSTLVVSCGVEPMAEKEKWLKQNVVELNTIMELLANSGIRRVQEKEYKNAAKYNTSEKDKEIYRKTVSWMSGNEIRSIHVARDNDGNVEAFVFGKGRCESARPVLCTDIIHTLGGVSVFDFYQNAECMRTSIENWYICRWASR